LGLTEISPEIEAKPKSLNYVRIYASLCVRQPLLDLTKQMAVEAVMSEPTLPADSPDSRAGIFHGLAENTLGIIRQSP
jgi:hypothetical protein